MENLNPAPTPDPFHASSRWTLSIVQLVLLFEGGLAVAACIAGWFMEVPPWQRIDWQWEQVGIGVAAALPMMLSLVGIRRVHVGPLARLNDAVDQLLIPLFANCSLLQLALIAAMAGIGEELLFRGVMQPLLSDLLGAIAGIAITSIIFGLLHAVTKTYAVLAFIVSVYLGWLAVASENLASATIAHALYDFFALVYLTRRLARRLAR